MSFEAMVWADKQKTGDPRLKLLLLLLGNGTHSLTGLSNDAEMSPEETAVCLRRLADMGLAYKVKDQEKYYLTIDSFATPLAPADINKLHEIYESKDDAIHDIVHGGRSISEVIKVAKGGVYEL